MTRGRAAASCALLLLLAGCGGADDPFSGFAEHVAARHQSPRLSADSLTVAGPAAGWQASVRPDPDSAEVAVSIGCPEGSFVLIGWLADEGTDGGSEWRACQPALRWATRPPGPVTVTLRTSPGLEEGQQLRIAVDRGTVTAAASL